MKKFGTMIIKPDATNFDELKLVQGILKKYDLYRDLSYRVSFLY